MIALIDADVIAYKAAFACDGESEEYLHGYIEEEVYKITEAADCESYKLYLTGTGNFRNKVAVTKPYKGNRKQEKPLHFQASRDYLVGMGAEVVDGKEADDAIGIDSQKMLGDCVICTIDKDLMMLEGFFFDFYHGQKGRTGFQEGQTWFMQQLLMGDPTDNIAGLPRVGKVGAKKILEGISQLQEMFQEVQTQYKERIGDNWKEYLEEMGKLLWIHQSAVDDWSISWYEGYLDAKLDE